MKKPINLSNDSG